MDSVNQFYVKIFLPQILVCLVKLTVKVHNLVYGNKALALMLRARRFLIKKLVLLTLLKRIIGLQKKNQIQVIIANLAISFYFLFK